MKIVFRGSIASEEIRSRLSSALKAYGVTKAARQLERSPGRLSNLASGNDPSMPLDLLLELESLLGADLMGNARDELSAKLRSLADRVDRSIDEG